MSRAGEGEQKAHISQTNIPTFSVDTDIVEGRVNRYLVNILIDTGAAATIVSCDVWEKIRSSGAVQITATGNKLVGVQGTPLQLNGTTHIDIELCCEKFSSDVIVADSLASDIILGQNFLKAHKCTIEMTPTKDLLYFKQHGKVVPIKSKQSNSTQDIPVDVVLNYDLEIPPYSEMEIMETIPEWSVGEKKVRNAGMVARAVVQPQGAQVPI